MAASCVLKAGPPPGGTGTSSTGGPEAEVGGEDNWGLNQLTHRDREATPILSAFDFEQEPREPDPLPLRDDCQGPIWAPAG